MTTRTNSLVAALLLGVAGSSWAQSAADELPAVSTSGASEEPAVQTAPEEAPLAAPAKSEAAAPAKASSTKTAATPKLGDGKNNEGTTIIGERESPIGLYITPWHNAAPEADIDRPARLLSVGLEVLDRRVFARQVEYYEALTAAQKAKSEGAPASSAKPAP